MSGIDEQSNIDEEEFDIELFKKEIGQKIHDEFFKIYNLFHMYGPPTYLNGLLREDRDVRTRRESSEGRGQEET